MAWLVTFHGHVWTIYPWLHARVRPPRAEPDVVRWSSLVEDPKAGSVRIRGELSGPADAERAVVLVHGLGGGYDSFYCRAAARAVSAHGWAVLNLALRGADLESHDYYHGALTTDVHHAIRLLAERYAAVHVLGFSIGGHIALHVARETTDPRLRSVAAIGAPLDLESASRHFDSPKTFLYRRHVLNGCKRVLASVATRATLPTPLAQVLAASSMRELDSMTVVPRYGFSSTLDYYQRSSIAPHLADLRRPALYIGAAHDPLVPASIVRPFLPPSGGKLSVHIVPRGGHLGYPADLDLGYSRERGLVPQVLGWFAGS